MKTVIEIIEEAMNEGALQANGTTDPTAPSEYAERVLAAARLEGEGVGPYGWLVEHQDANGGWMHGGFHDNHREAVEEALYGDEDGTTRVIALVRRRGGAE